MVIFFLWRDILRVSAAVDSAGNDKWAVIMLESDCSKLWIFFFSSQHIKKKKRSSGKCLDSFLYSATLQRVRWYWRVVSLRQSVKITSLVFSGKMTDSCQLERLIPAELTASARNPARGSQITCCLSQKVWVTARQQWKKKSSSSCKAFKVWWSQTNHKIIIKHRCGPACSR